MSLRKSPHITPALLAANRLNAQKSTGPRTLRGRVTAAQNSFKHGLRSHWFGETMLNSHESRENFLHAAHSLLELLKPCNRPGAARAVRYAQMLWAINRRFIRYRFVRTRKKKLMEISRAERALHQRVKKDLQQPRAYIRLKLRRKFSSITGLMKIVDMMPDARPQYREFDERTRNVV
jgi:hypothetical protein